MQAVAKLALSLAAIVGAQPAPPSVPAGPTLGPTEKLIYGIKTRFEPMAQYKVSDERGLEV